MTPKEKAKELVSKFTFLSYPESNAKFYNPKQCALIAVDEILNNFGSAADGKTFFTSYSTIEFWQEVKQEIEAL